MMIYIVNGPNGANAEGDANKSGLGFANLQSFVDQQF
jgi:hypothetical protein